MVLTSAYSVEGYRTSLTANLGGTLSANGTVSGGINDFLNSYSYNSAGDMTGIAQTGQSGGSLNGVAAKNAALSYNFDGQVTGVTLYASSGTSNTVVTSSYTRDDDSRLTDLVYTAGGSTIAGYHLDYNGNSTVADEYSRNNTSGTPGASYTSWAKTTNLYDHDAELTNSSYSSSFVNPPAGSGGATQSFDGNGNRTNVALPSYLTTATGAGNRMLYDGTYCYQYDPNGNVIARWVDNNNVAENAPAANDTDITTYAWNNKCQLSLVSHYPTYAARVANTPDWQVAYAYDAFGNMVLRTPTGISGESAEDLVYDGQNLALVLNGSGQVTERELYAAGIDMILASEEITPGSGGGTQAAGTVNWLLTDNQGTVRDVAGYTAGTTTVEDHIVYGSFGALTSQTGSSYQPTLTYDGDWQDPKTALDYNGTNWYNAVDGVFANQDPFGLAAGQTNLSEYAGNNPASAMLQNGLESVGSAPGSAGNSAADSVWGAVGLLASGGSAVPVYGGSQGGNELGLAVPGGGAGVILVGTNQVPGVLNPPTARSNVPGVLNPPTARSNVPGVLNPPASWSNVPGVLNPTPPSNGTGSSGPTHDGGGNPNVSQAEQNKQPITPTGVLPQGGPWNGNVRRTSIVLRA